MYVYIRMHKQVCTREKDTLALTISHEDETRNGVPIDTLAPTVYLSNVPLLVNIIRGFCIPCVCVCVCVRIQIFTKRYMHTSMMESFYRVFC